MASQLRVILLFLALSFLFMLVGTFVGAAFFGSATAGFAIFLVLSIAMNVATYFWSDKFVLWSTGAKVVEPHQAPRLHRIVDKVCAASGMPKPKVAVMPSPVPNAFATGRNPDNAVVAATEGILRLLDDDELEAVMAHEMGHVRNRDILVTSIAATIAMAITFPFRILFWSAIFGGGDNDRGSIIGAIVLGIVVGIAATLIQLAISRSREYGADHTGAEISGKPYALASALGKLEDMNYRHPMHQANAGTASLFIVNPLSGGSVMAMLSTHPPTKKRIARLEDYAQQRGLMR